MQKIDEKKREGKQNSQSHVYVYLEATRPALDFKIKLGFFWPCSPFWAQHWLLYPGVSGTDAGFENLFFSCFFGLFLWRQVPAMLTKPWTCGSFSASASASCLLSPKCWDYIYVSPSQVCCESKLIFREGAASWSEVLFRFLIMLRVLQPCQQRASSTVRKNKIDGQRYIEMLVSLHDGAFADHYIGHFSSLKLICILILKHCSIVRSNLWLQLSSHNNILIICLWGT